MVVDVAAHDEIHWHPQKRTIQGSDHENTPRPEWLQNRRDPGGILSEKKLYRVQIVILTDTQGLGLSHCGIESLRPCVIEPSCHWAIALSRNFVSSPTVDYEIDKSPND